MHKLRGFLRLALSLRRESFEMVLLTTKNKELGLLCKIVLGFVTILEVRRIDDLKKIPFLNENRLKGFRPSPPLLNQADLPSARNLLAKLKKEKLAVFLSPLPHSAGEIWPLALWLRLCDELVELGYYPVWFARPVDQASIKAFMISSRYEKRPLLDFCFLSDLGEVGASLTSLALTDYLVSQCREELQIAAAFSRNCLGLHFVSEGPSFEILSAAKMMILSASHPGNLGLGEVVSGFKKL